MQSNIVFNNGNTSTIHNVDYTITYLKIFLFIFKRKKSYFQKVCFFEKKYVKKIICIFQLHLKLFIFDKIY